MPILRPPSENVNPLPSGGSALAAESAKLLQKQTALVELRIAMEKRDRTAAEAARLADEEAHLEEEIQVATQEKAATLAEAQAQWAVMESAQAHWESLQGSPAASLEEARRNLNLAKTASDTATREARVAADVLVRIEGRLAEVRAERGKMRWQQAADHEAFEKGARILHVFTPEALQEALAEIEKAQAALEKRLQENQAVR